MALFMKQDFNPPILSRRWLAIKLRPNMLINSRRHIESILESGLLFREDSIEVEQEAPSHEEVWRAAGGRGGGWVTRGEAVASAAAVAAAVLVLPPRSFNRTIFINLATYLALPVAIRTVHRTYCRGSLLALLEVMRDYLALARRAAACLKEYAALYAQLGSLTSVIESTHTMLCRQQSETAILLSRASSALLGAAPWLRADVAWGAVARDHADLNLMKIHHAFLVVQSTLLKHIAMAHYVPSVRARKLYKNHNERIYWIHNVLIKYIYEEFKQNYDSLERMYRLLKNSANKNDDVKKLGIAVNDSWVYSDVHTGVARACLELKYVLNKCNTLDMFLDSCALNKENLDLDILNNDIDDLIDKITKCLTTVQNSQIRLKKLRGKVMEKVKQDGVEVVEETAPILTIEDREPESKDEVFYFVKTDDDNEAIQPAGDLTTAPGKKEKENTKVVMTELKRKLGKREDLMRERERQALIKTMPEFKDNVPEFPRQIKLEEFLDKKGYITKLSRNVPTRRLFKNYKIGSKNKNKKCNKYRLKISKYYNENNITGDFYEANAKFNFKSKLVTVSIENKHITITKWCKYVGCTKEIDSSGLSEGLSDVESSTVNETVNQAVNTHPSYKVSKKDLELSSSDTDLECQLLNDIRRQRAARKKNHLPHKRGIDNVDESLKPIEYSFGTGLAMASVLQVNNQAKIPNMAAEEVFIGDGEVSCDSGNDEDA